MDFPKLLHGFVKIDTWISLKFFRWIDQNWLLIVYFHCIGIQRLYIRLWWYGKIISLNPTTAGVEPSERSWRSKEHIFISMRTLIHRVFSRKSGYYTRLQKSGICIFILCALSATRNCVFSCQKEKKLGWWKWYDGIQFREVHGKQFCIEKVEIQKLRWERKKVVILSGFFRSSG